MTTRPGETVASAAVVAMVAGVVAVAALAGPSETFAATLAALVGSGVVMVVLCGGGR